jgi:aromatic ring-cleaving dioxygenase
MIEAGEIKSYHSHVYYESETRPLAEALRSRMETLFPAAIYGRWHDRPVGPHPSSMFQIAFSTELFAAIVPWLIVNHGPLTIFLHPNTGKALTDHAQRAVWMGRQRQLDLSVLSDAE